MGRTGITALDVADAAVKLQERGKVPTVDGVREVLGTGSKTTIASYLKAWKEGQGSVMDSNLPPALVNTVSSLWNNLQEVADNRIQHELEALNVEKQRWQQALSELQQENAKLVKQLTETNAALEALRAKQQETESQLSTEQQKLLLAQQELTVRAEQLNEAKAENAKLHQLTTHIQANLEHYQNSMQQLHTQHSLALERQQAMAQQEIRQLREQLNQTAEQAILLHQQLQERSSHCAHLEATNAELKQQQQAALTAEKQAQTDYLILQERYNLQQELQSQEKQARERIDLLLEDEKNKALLLSEANIRLTVEVERLNNKVHELKNEQKELTL